MSRKSVAGKSGKTASPTLSNVTSAPRTVPEEVPLFPEMPSFFPDPVTLDVDDSYLKVFRDDLFAREYERSAKAFFCTTQQQEPKKSLSSSKFSGHIRGLQPQRLDESSQTRVTLHEKSALSSLISSPSAGTDTVCGTSRTHKRERAELKSTSFVDVFDNFPSEGRHDENDVNLDPENTKGKNSGGVEVDCKYQQRQSHLGQTAPDFYLYSPGVLSPELLKVVNEVGMTNATPETRAIMMRLSKMQQEGSVAASSAVLEEAGDDMSPQTLLGPASQFHSTSFPLSPEITAMSASPPYASSFPLGDALVLEAEQRVSAEMFCESICNDIVKKAMETYLMHCFDETANLYTALSVWDEVHDAVTRSFIPQEPRKPLCWMSQLAVPVQQPKKGQLQPAGCPPDTSVEVFASNGHRNYLNMLPSWSPTPSLLDADETLSFYQQRLEKNKNLSENANMTRKLNGLGVQLQSSTFSRLLSAPIHPMEKKVWCGFAMKNLCEKTVDDNDDDDCGPGTPPNGISLDDYARYVIPIVDSLQQQPESRTKEGTSSWRTSSHSKRGYTPSTRAKTWEVVYRKDVNGKSNTNSVSIRNDERLGGVTNKLQTITRKRKGGKTGRRAIPSDENSIKKSVTLSSATTTKAPPPEIVDDEWTKALKQLPRGFFTTTTEGSGTGLRNLTSETLVLIGGDHTATYTTYSRHKEKACDGSLKASPRSTSLRKSNTAITLDKNLTDDGNDRVRVSIANGGQVSLQVEPSSNDRLGETNEGGTDQQQNSLTISVQEKRNENRLKTFSILSQKKQKTLEEQRRRQEEAAERAAYEGMFFKSNMLKTGMPPRSQTVLSSGDNTGNLQQEEECQELGKMIPEPGVIIEQCAATSIEKNIKTNDLKNAKRRGYRNKLGQKTNQHANDDNLLTDGGPWISPEGKHPWAAFEAVSEERNVKGVAAVMSSGLTVAAERQPGAPLTATLQRVKHPKQKQQDLDKGDGRKQDDKGVTNSNAPTPANRPTGVKPPSRCAPPSILFTRTSEQNVSTQNELERENLGAVQVEKEAESKSKKRAHANAQPMHEMTKVPKILTLPRIPPNSVKGGCKTPEKSRYQTRCATADGERVILLASILQGF